MLVAVLVRRHVGGQLFLLPFTLTGGWHAKSCQPGRCVELVGALRRSAAFCFARGRTSLHEPHVMVCIEFWGVGERRTSEHARPPQISSIAHISGFCFCTTTRSQDKSGTPTTYTPSFDHPILLRVAVFRCWSCTPLPLSLGAGCATAAGGRLSKKRWLSESDGGPHPVECSGNARRGAFFFFFVIDIRRPDRVSRYPDRSTEKGQVPCTYEIREAVAFLLMQTAKNNNLSSFFRTFFFFISHVLFVLFAFFCFSGRASRISDVKTTGLPALGSRRCCATPGVSGRGGWRHEHWGTWQR